MVRQSEAKTIFEKTEIVDRKTLLKEIANYHTSYPEEQKFIPLFQKLLEHPRAYHRDHLPGHMTGSAWIINSAKTKVFLTHHAKLNRWLQPGGHADGDEDILNVARKEGDEETGLKSLTLLRPVFFDIDIHTIPARKDFPQHDHYDVRFLFEADDAEEFLVSEESHELAWVRIEDLLDQTQGNDSMIRMAEKVAQLFGHRQ